LPGSPPAHAPSHDAPPNAREFGHSRTEPEAPAWPSEAEEAAFLSEATTENASAKLDSPSPAAAGPPLPSLDSLVQRIPAEVRAALDEHFRAKFVSVRRVPPEIALKENERGAGKQPNA
jgi:hypothetical protein